MRDPVDTYESGYVYMGLEKQYRMNINQFAKRLIDGKFPKRRQGGTQFSIFFSKHFRFFLLSAWFDVDETLWDLGFNISLLDDFNFVDKSIEYLNNEFDVVLIAEQFDEDTFEENYNNVIPVSLIISHYQVLVEKY